MKKIDAATIAAMPVGAILLGFFWNDVMIWPLMDESVQIAGGAVIGAAVRYIVAWFPHPGE